MDRPDGAVHDASDESISEHLYIATLCQRLYRTSWSQLNASAARSRPLSLIFSACRLDEPVRALEQRKPHSSRSHHNLEKPYENLF